MTMRWLSISQTLRWHSSARRRPVAYSIINMVHQVLRGSNEPRHFLLTEYCGHPPLTLGKWNVIGKIRPSECLDEEKTQRSGTTFDGPRRELAVAKQVNLVLANMFWAE